MEVDNSNVVLDWRDTRAKGSYPVICPLCKSFIKTTKVEREDGVLVMVECVNDNCNYKVVYWEEYAKVKGDQIY